MNHKELDAASTAGDQKRKEFEKAHAAPKSTVIAEL
jgi:hypothetical protein